LQKGEDVLFPALLPRLSGDKRITLTPRSTPSEVYSVCMHLRKPEWWDEFQTAWFESSFYRKNSVMLKLNDEILADKATNYELLDPPELKEMLNHRTPVHTAVDLPMVGKLPNLKMPSAIVDINLETDIVVEEKKKEKEVSSSSSSSSSDESDVLIIGKQNVSEVTNLSSTVVDTDVLTFPEVPPPRVLEVSPEARCRFATVTDDGGPVFSLYNTCVSVGVDYLSMKRLQAANLFFSCFFFVLSAYFPIFVIPAILSPFTSFVPYVYKHMIKVATHHGVAQITGEYIQKAAEKGTQVREASFWWIPGWERMTTLQKNMVATFFSGITLTAIGVIIWGTIRWIKGQKKKILKEGATPGSLSTDYIKHIFGVCMMAGVLTGVTIRISSFIGAVKNLNNVYSAFAQGSWKKVWDSGKLTEESNNIDDYSHDILSGRVFIKQEHLVYVSSRSSNIDPRRFWLKVRTNEQVLLDHYRVQLNGIYHDLVDKDLNINWQTAVAQRFLNDIVAQQIPASGLIDFNLCLAVKWNPDMVHKRIYQGKDTWFRSINCDNFYHQFRHENNNKFPYYVSSFLQRYVVVNKPNLSVYRFTRANMPDQLIIAASNEDAKETFKICTVTDPEPFTLLENIQAFIYEHKEKIVGLIGLITVIYIATYYWYQNKWVNKDKKIQKEAVEVKEHRSGPTKGQNIKSAQDYQSNETFKELCKERDNARQKMYDYQDIVLNISSYGSGTADEEDALDNARRNLSLISRNLARLTADCDQMYANNYDFDSRPAHRKQTRVNNDKKLPNSEKPRKMKEDLIVIDTDEKTIEVITPPVPFDVSKKKTKEEVKKQILEVVLKCKMCKNNQSLKGQDYCTPCLDKYNKEKKVKKECCHAQDCPMQLPIDAFHDCNKACGGHHCTHWAGCKPSTEKKVESKPKTPKVESKPKTPESKNNETFNKCSEPLCDKAVVNNKYTLCLDCFKKNSPRSSIETDLKCRMCHLPFEEYMKKSSNRSKKPSKERMFCKECQPIFGQAWAKNIKLPAEEKLDFFAFCDKMSELKLREKAEALHSKNLPNNTKKETKKIINHEAVVNKTTNNQSVSKQSPAEKTRALIPMYIPDPKKNGDFVYNGVITLGISNGIRVLTTCTHQLRDNKCYISYVLGFKVLEFTHHYDNDISAMTCPSSVMPKGEVLTYSVMQDKVDDVKLYSLDVSDPTKQVQVWLSGMYVEPDGDNDQVIAHKSDSFGGQCGSPYVTNNNIVGLHNSSDNEMNRGVVLPVKFFRDF